MTNRYGDTVYAQGTVKRDGGLAVGIVGETAWLEMNDGRKVQLRILDEFGLVDVISKIGEVIQ